MFDKFAFRANTQKLQSLVDFVIDINYRTIDYDTFVVVEYYLKYIEDNKAFYVAFSHLSSDHEGFVSKSIEHINICRNKYSEIVESKSSFTSFLDDQIEYKLMFESKERVKMKFPDSFKYCIDICENNQVEEFLRTYENMDLSHFMQ